MTQCFHQKPIEAYSSGWIRVCQVFCLFLFFLLLITCQLQSSGKNVDHGQRLSSICWNHTAKQPCCRHEAKCWVWTPVTIETGDWKAGEEHTAWDRCSCRVRASSDPAYQCKQVTGAESTAPAVRADHRQQGKRAVQPTGDRWETGTIEWVRFWMPGALPHQQ